MKNFKDVLIKDGMERVARAIYCASSQLWCWEDERNGNQRESYKRLARAAIAAMGGGKRWGVWRHDNQKWMLGWNTNDPFVTSEEHNASGLPEILILITSMRLIRMWTVKEHCEIMKNVLKN